MSTSEWHAHGSAGQKETRWGRRIHVLLHDTAEETNGPLVQANVAADGMRRGSYARSGVGTPVRLARYHVISICI